MNDQIKAADLSQSICAVLLAWACNISLKAVTQAEVPMLTLPHLSWVQQNYVRMETLTAVMRTLQRAGSLSGLGRAVAELGRVEKTLYLLACVQLRPPAWVVPTSYVGPCVLASRVATPIRDFFS